MGVTAGYTISFREVSVRAKGAIALTAKPGMSQADADAIWAEHGRLIVQMNNVAHLKITNLPFSTARKRLTKRQREALEWVGDGKTTQDIAVDHGADTRDGGKASAAGTRSAGCRDDGAGGSESIVPRIRSLFSKREQ